MLAGMFLKHSSLQSKVPISVRANGAAKLSVIIDTNKLFENYQQYFSGDGKHCIGRCEHRSTMGTKYERKILSF